MHVCVCMYACVHVCVCVHYKPQRGLQDKSVHFEEVNWTTNFKAFRISELCHRNLWLPRPSPRLSRPLCPRKFCDSSEHLEKDRDQGGNKVQHWRVSRDQGRAIPPKDFPPQVHSHPTPTEECSGENSRTQEKPLLKQ